MHDTERELPCVARFRMPGWVLSGLVDLQNYVVGQRAFDDVLASGRN